MDAIPNNFKMNQFKIFILSFGLLVLISFNSCYQPEANYPGTEYMPDMGHSVAYEANVYNHYYLNTWDNESVRSLKELSNPRLPVNGTIPRTSSAGFSDNSISVPVNGSVPYYYGNTDAERARAMAEIIDNPFPITESGLARGKELYNVFCGVCHGEKGDGNGWLVDEANANAVYPAQPANFLQDTFYNSSNGRFYHAIVHGKGVMGGYTDKISYEERWQVIHYIHSLQAKEKKLAYSETENTLTSALIDVPGASMPKVAQKAGNQGAGSDVGTGTGQGDGTHSHEGESHDHGTEGGEHSHDADHSHGEDH